MLTCTHSIGPHVRIRFSAKPDERIQTMLKANGFRWSPVGGFWWRRQVKGAADFLAALERRLNPGKPDGACWRCRSPEGFFRPQGPATPVYCNACWETLQTNLAKAERGEAVPRIDRSDLDYEDRCREACGL